MKTRHQSATRVAASSALLCLLAGGAVATAPTASASAPGSVATSQSAAVQVRAAHHKKTWHWVNLNNAAKDRGNFKSPNSLFNYNDPHWLANFSGDYNTHDGRITFAPNWARMSVKIPSQCRMVISKTYLNPGNNGDYTAGSWNDIFLTLGGKSATGRATVGSDGTSGPDWTAVGIGNTRKGNLGGKTVTYTTVAQSPIYGEYRYAYVDISAYCYS